MCIHRKYTHLHPAQKNNANGTESVCNLAQRKTNLNMLVNIVIFYNMVRTNLKYLIHNFVGFVAVFVLVVAVAVVIVVVAVMIVVFGVFVALAFLAAQKSYR